MVCCSYYNNHMAVKISQVRKTTNVTETSDCYGSSDYSGKSDGCPNKCIGFNLRKFVSCDS